MRKLKSLLLVVVILFIVAAVMPIKAFAAPAANEQEIVTVELRDRNMYEVLKKTVTCIDGTANDETKNYTLKIRLRELEKVTSLDLSNKDIGVLIGIEKFRNLTELNISGNKLDDISFLSNLKKLEVLDASNNRQGSSSGISDLSPLEGLTTLTSLNLEKNSISDVASLGGLTKLTYLNVADNKIKDVSDLEKLTELTEINITKNKVTDISCFENFTHLITVRISNNEISDISPLKNLNLETLFLEENAILDLSLIEDKGLNVGESCKQDIKLTVGTRQPKLPKVFISAQDSNSMFYSNKPLVLYRGQLSTDKTKFVINQNVDATSFAEVSIDSGLLKGSTLIFKYQEGLVEEPEEEPEEPEEEFIKDPKYMNETEENTVTVVPKPEQPAKPGLLELFLESAVSNWQFIIAIALGGALLVVGVAILKSKKKKKKKKVNPENGEEQKEEPKDNIKVVKF